MTYDVISMLSKAAMLVEGPLTGQAIHDILRLFGTSRLPAYQGVSGRIVFDGQGNPINKALFVLQVVGSGSGNSMRIEKIIGTY